MKVTVHDLVVTEREVELPTVCPSMHISWTCGCGHVLAESQETQS